MAHSKGRSAPLIASDAEPGRRRFVSTAMRLPLAAMFAAAIPWSGRAQAASVESSDARSRMLQRIIYLLFPFPELGEAPYRRVVAALEAQLSGAPDRRAIIEQGLLRLRQAVAGEWPDADEGDQQRALASEQGSAFFQLLYGHAVATLFNDPALWQLVGYEGSSLEFGGYLQHGLNDIDWLD